jgi:hypothetical protein
MNKTFELEFFTVRNLDDGVHFGLTHRVPGLSKTGVKRRMRVENTRALPHKVKFKLFEVTRKRARLPSLKEEQ